MTVLTKEGDLLLGEKVYCVFERMRGPHRVSTGSRHNAQAVTIEGNPAKAMIVKAVRWGKRLEHLPS